MKKIAVNIVDEINLQEAHDNVINFLYSTRDEYFRDLEQNNIKIDYYICHPHVKEIYTGPLFENSTITSSVLTNEEVMFNNVHNGTNTEILARLKNLFRVMYRSYINSQAIHQNTTKHLYDMVISYDKNHSLMYFKTNKKNFTLEQDFMFINIIEPRWLNVDYTYYACATSTFFKIVNFWRFLSIVSDQTFNIWTWLDGRIDADRFIFPMWLSNQNIKVRNIRGL